MKDTTLMSGTHTPVPFHRSLPLLVQAEQARRDGHFAEATGLFNQGLTPGVRSSHLHFLGAIAAAGASDTQRAFAFLDGMQRLGLQSDGPFAISLLDPLHGDPRWNSFVAEASAASSRLRDPNAARILTDDIERFWRAFDAAEGVPSPVEVFERHYVDPASPALQAFLVANVGPTQDLVEALRYYDGYYRSVRECTGSIRELEPTLRGIFQRLEAAYPDATFPDVTFVVGRLASAGTSTTDGLVIGVEQACRTSTSPVEGMNLRRQQSLMSYDDIPPIVAHEIAHFQQNFRDQESLLAAALLEGGADFVAELLFGVTTASRVLHSYGGEHEAALWQEFRRDMHRADAPVLSRWVRGSEASPERPGDLGYYVGYRIVRAYYEKQADKRRALSDIFNVTDPAAFLAASGYSPT